MKRPGHCGLDLALLDEESGHAADLLTLWRVLAEITQETLPRAIGVFEDDGEKEETKFADLRHRMQNLKVVARAKVTKDRVYNAAYRLEPMKDLIFLVTSMANSGYYRTRARSRTRWGRMRRTSGCRRSAGAGSTKEVVGRSHSTRRSVIVLMTTEHSSYRGMISFASSRRYLILFFILRFRALWASMREEAAGRQRQGELGQK